MTFSHTVETDAAPERVWEIWTDVSRWPEWDTELITATLEGEFRAGARGTLKPRTGPPSAFTIAELEPGRSYTFTTQLPACRLNVRRVLEPTARGTRFTHEVSFAGPMALLFQALLEKGFAVALPGVMDRVDCLAVDRTAHGEKP
jgi:uncharacterized protein YndB with AHSA1/START domain